MKNTNLILIGILALVIGAGAGFFGGMKYQQNQRPTNFGNLAGRQGQQMQRNNNFRPVNGEILSVGEGTFTVKLTDGSSKIVMLAGSTTINKADTATVADLKTGTTVAVFGQTNTDGSVSAQNIQINPLGITFSEKTLSK